MNLRNIKNIKSTKNFWRKEIINNLRNDTYFCNATNEERYFNLDNEIHGNTTKNTIRFRKLRNISQDIL
jgi:hypothetical protein